VKFAGGSYVPRTEVGQHVEKVIRGSKRNLEDELEEVE
jgi:ribosomal protein L37AE/L43A